MSTGQKYFYETTGARNGTFVDYFGVPHRIFEEFHSYDARRRFVSHTMGAVSGRMLGKLKNYLDFDPVVLKVPGNLWAALTVVHRSIKEDEWIRGEDDNLPLSRTKYQF